MERQHTGVRGASGRRRSVRPVFVVSPARSGSTLLRYLLDSHPDITAPPEMNISALLQHLVDMWGNVDAAVGLDLRNGDTPAGVIAPEIARRARKAVDDILITVANAAGASVYCDKSLTTVDHLRTISQVYPKAAFVFLHRYPLDMIASGLEAGRWGFSAYGFAPFVAQNQGNFVAALANYWIDRVTKMVAFEKQCEQAHARIYYEMLCDDPGATLSQLFELLELPADEGVIERTFSTDHGAGPGDYKIDYTGSIGLDSIGRGATLPDRMGEAQLQRIDELLAELDYPSLEAGRRGNLAMLLGLSHSKATLDPNGLIDRTVGLLRDRMREAELEAHRQVLPVEIVLRGTGGDEPLITLNSDGTLEVAERAEPAENNRRLRIFGDVLLRVSEGEVPFSRAVHEGEIRVEERGGAEGQPPIRPQRVLALLATLLRVEG